MWKYIVIWTFINVVTTECPEKDNVGSKCTARHLSYEFHKNKVDTLNREKSFKLYDSLKAIEVRELTDKSRLTKVNIDSVFIPIN